VTDGRTDGQTDGIAIACALSIYAVARKNRLRVASEIYDDDDDDDDDDDISDI